MTEYEKLCLRLLAAILRNVAKPEIFNSSTRAELALLDKVQRTVTVTPNSESGVV